MNNSPTSFTIKTERFEGPFDALLSMIEKKKLHISEVSLSAIADEYIDYVTKHEFVLKEVALFIHTAATLMLIKSRHLLPQFSITDEEEEDISNLEHRIHIYALFKKQMSVIENQFGRARIFGRKNNKRKAIIFRADHRVTPERMRDEMRDVFTTVEPEVFVPQKKVATQRSLKEVIDDIALRLKRFVRVNFSELVAQADRREHAVSFLAVLELFKRGEVELNQEQAFATIQINTVDKEKETSCDEN